MNHKLWSVDFLWATLASIQSRVRNNVINFWSTYCLTQLIFFQLGTRQSFEFSMATPLIPEYEKKTLAKYRLYIGAGDNPFYYTDTLLPLPIRLKHVERSDFAKKAWENTISTLCFVGGSLKKKYTQKIKWNVLIAHNLRLSSLHDIAVVCQNHPGCNPFIDIGLNV